MKVNLPKDYLKMVAKYACITLVQYFNTNIYAIDNAVQLDAL